MMTRLGLWFLSAIAHWPLARTRTLGRWLGFLVYFLIPRRRRVVLRNLELCFPQLTIPQRKALARRNVECFCQALLDRSWLWHAPKDVIEQRVRLTGAVHELQGNTPTVIFAPHFYGMDAAGAAIMLSTPRESISIYKNPSNADVDQWFMAGRTRFGNVIMVNRSAGIRPVLSRLRKGGLLYLLPDINFISEESIFVPFYGIQTATVESLPRFAHLGRAKVVPVLARMTDAGYDAQVLPAWENYPTDDITADTARMNRSLETYIATMPEQYYWVHMRFKTRPEGEASLYD